jgi:hypothetical protein
MPTILFYFFIALVVVGGVMLAVPDENTPSEPPFSPVEIMKQVKP